MITSSCAGTIYNAFDGANRLITVVYTDGTPQVANSYNADGTKATVVQGTGGSANTSTYLYDGVGRLTKVTNGEGAITTYAYDTEGHRVCVSYPNATATCSANQASDTGQTGLVTSYFNTNGQLSKMTDWLGTSFNYLYDGAGNVCAMSTGGVPTSCANVPTSGVTATSTFDQQGNLAATAIAHGTSPLYGLSYSRDNNGNLASSQATIGGTAQTAANYTYDQQTQVASGPVSSVATGSTNAYTADHGITAASGFRTASYSPSGQLCWNYSSSSSNACGSTPTGGTGFTYDASGDRLSQFTQGLGSTTTTQSFGWSQESERLCWNLAGASSNTCASPPSGATAFSYDANGLRTSETAGSTIITFTWDQSAQDLLTDGTHYFVYGTSSTVPTEEISTSGSPLVSDLLATDQIGNVRALVRLSGSTLTNAVTNVTSYDSYGNPIVAPGGATEPGGVSVAETGLNSNYVDTSPFDFGEGYIDGNGLLYLQNRYYDSGNEQFISVDPAVEATGQPYTYVNNSPTAGVDPTGQDCNVIEWLIIPAGCAIEAGAKAVGWNLSIASSINHAAITLAKKASANVGATLSAISTVASVVALVSSSLSFIPFVGTGLEIVALAAGTVAVTADLANCAAHEFGVKKTDCSWTSIAIDIAAVVPGLGAAELTKIEKGSSYLSKLSRADNAAGRSISKITKGPIYQMLKSNQVKRQTWKFSVDQLSRYMGAAGVTNAFVSSHK